MLIRLVRAMHREERGISAVIVAVSMVAIFGAAMLSIDSGALWTSRRTIITGTDASALDAAEYFNGNLPGLSGNPCDASSLATVEQHATNVLTANNPSALHNSTDTPNGFQVTLSGPCTTPYTYTPGKVRFDGRLPASRTLSGFFGFSNLRTFSSSTAAWGYVQAIGSGLRPIAICDQSNVSYPQSPPPLPPAGFYPPYPHYYLWKLLMNGTITQAYYDSFFGSDDNNGSKGKGKGKGGTQNDPEYPAGSWGYLSGQGAGNPNANQAYGDPSIDPRFHTVHRIKMPNVASDCSQTPGNIDWVDLTGNGNPGGIGASTLNSWLANGYPGTVSISPHDCNPSNAANPEDCGARTGTINSTEQQGLKPITCPAATPALSCPVIFPILVVSNLQDPGSTGHYYQVAFLYVVMRGYGSVNQQQLEVDLEFVNVPPVNAIIGATNPNPNEPTMTAVQFCGVDNDPKGAGADHCPF